MDVSLLEHLPPLVKQALGQPDFVFLIFPDKVQHFPARQWKKQEYQEMLAEKATTPLHFSLWENQLVAQGKADSLIVMPKFNQLDALVEKKSPADSRKE